VCADCVHLIMHMHTTFPYHACLPQSAPHNANFARTPTHKHFSARYQNLVRAPAHQHFFVRHQNLVLAPTHQNFSTRHQNLVRAPTHQHFSTRCQNLACAAACQCCSYHNIFTVHHVFSVRLPGHIHLYVHQFIVNSIAEIWVFG
jgi:hypothetical protein